MNQNLRHFETTMTYERTVFVVDEFRVLEYLEILAIARSLEDDDRRKLHNVSSVDELEG